MIEDKLLHATINAEMRLAYSTACNYLKVYAKFVGCKNIPQLEIGSKTAGENMINWLNYYFKLWDVVGTQITTNLAIIRKKYHEKNDDIPTIPKESITS